MFLEQFRAPNTNFFKDWLVVVVYVKNYWSHATGWTLHLFDYNTHSSSIFSLSSLISLRVMCFVPELRAWDVFWGIRHLPQDPYLNSKREKKRNMKEKWIMVKLQLLHRKVFQMLWYLCIGSAIEFLSGCTNLDVVVWWSNILESFSWW